MLTIRSHHAVTRPHGEEFFLRTHTPTLSLAHRADGMALPREQVMNQAVVR